MKLKVILMSALLLLSNALLAQVIKDGRYALINRNSNLALDVMAVSKENGALLQQWGYAGGSNQQFDITHQGNGYYSVKAVHSGKVLDVKGISLDLGAPVQQYTWANQANQLWYIASIDTGYYTLTAKHSGQALEVWQQSKVNGGEVRQYRLTNGLNQQWKFQAVSVGSPSGCPLLQEGFSTVNAMGQNGTTGGQGGKTVTVTNQADLNRYATAAEPYIIRVQGSIKFSPKGTEIRVASDKTIIGVGTSGEIIEGGFFLGAGVHNVIIRNLTIRDGFVDGDLEGKTNDFDAIQMDTAHHIWIDHNHLTRMGDGLIDSRKDTTYLTASWNILSNHNKAFGIGWTDNVTTQMTIHHNWLRDLNQRNPSTDNVLRAHLYNNWMQRLSSYGNYARQATNMVIENSVFDSVNNPHYYDTGSLVAIGNIYRNTTGQKESSGSAYSFFNPKNFYNYTLHPANEVEALLTKCAGPRPELGQ